MGCGRCSVALAIGLAALVVPSVGSAAVTIGEDTSTTGNATFFGCSGFAGPICTFAQTAHPTHSYTAPFDGVIVRWRIRGDSEAVQFSLRALHKNDGTFTGAGTGEPRTVAPGVENVFDARLPIRQGEFIGLNVPGGSDLPHVDRRSVPGATFSIWNPTPLQDGETRAPDSTGFVNALLYNADVEPDCDSDSLGDETQDPDISSCNPPPQTKADRTLTLDANKGKVEKGRKVRLTGQIDAPQNEAGCEPNQTVELQRKAKKAPDTAFATFKAVQTDQAGNFADKVKVKKTRIYRAVVQESASCDDELSNTQKVRVQKKKAAQEA
jgi:hypothetical protein